MISLSIGRRSTPRGYTHSLRRTDVKWIYTELAEYNITLAGQLNYSQSSFNLKCYCRPESSAKRVWHLLKTYFGRSFKHLLPSVKIVLWQLFSHHSTLNPSMLYGFIMYAVWYTKHVYALQLVGTSSRCRLPHSQTIWYLFLSLLFQHVQYSWTCSPPPNL